MSPEKVKPILRLYVVYHQRANPECCVGASTYLGVELSSDRTWNKQVEKVAAKANRTLGFIRRTVTTSSTEAKGGSLHDTGMTTDGIPHLHHRRPHKAIDQHARESAAPCHVLGHRIIAESEWLV